MTSSYLYILIGLGLLAGGGDLLLRGAVRLAQKLSLTPAVIGLTVVAVGTSVPELAVSILASFRGSTDIAVGNVVGSNILNVTLILGLAAILTPLAVTGSIIKLEYPLMLLTTLLAVVVFQDGTVGRLDGILFIASYIGITAYLVWIVREKMQNTELAQISEEVAELSEKSEALREIRSILGYLVVGVALLAVGAELTVHGAVEIGRSFGMTERVIGLTIVACGTSLPEIITSLIAGVRGRDDVAIANVIGSNLFNLLGILGLSSLLAPLPVAAEIRSHDVYWMLGSAVILFPLMRSGMRITRLEGFGLLAVFLGYLYSLV